MMRVLNHLLGGVSGGGGCLLSSALQQIGLRENPATTALIPYHTHRQTYTDCVDPLSPVCALSLIHI